MTLPLDQGVVPGHAAFLPPGPAADAPARRRGRGAGAFALWLLVGGAIGALGAIAGRGLATSPPAWLPASLSLPLVLLAAALSLWPSIVLHEAGHALAGIARGMRPLAFGIGPLRWERGQARWRFRRDRGVGGIAGFAALLPVGDRGLSRADQMAYLAGGPAANLLTTALCLALVAALPPAHAAASWLLGIGGCALLLGAANLLPFHSQGWRSDGRGLLDLLLDNTDAVLHQRIQHVLALNMAGVRPRDWPDAAVPPAASPDASPMLALNGDLLRLAWAMDRNDAPAAAEVARRATAAFPALPVAMQPHLAVALAGYAARLLRDPAVLAAWRPLCAGGVTDLSLMRAWLDAELAALSGDPGGARAALADAHALLDRAPDPVTARLLGEYLDALAQRLDARTADAGPAVKDA